MTKRDPSTLPYAVYLVIWTATFVTLALVAVIWFVPAAPREILIAIGVMFLMFSTIITMSDTVYWLLSGTRRSKPAQTTQPGKPASDPPKILPPKL